MTHRCLHHRLWTRPLISTKEDRLCFAYETPPVRPSFSPEGSWTKWFASKPAWFAGEVVQFAAEVAVDIPMGAIQGVCHAWTNQEKLDKEAFKATMLFLKDDFNWIEAFKEDELFTKVEVTPIATTVFGPKELLWSLSLAARKEIFFDYVNKYFPEGGQAMHLGVFADPNNPNKSVRITNMVKNRSVIVAAYDLVLGNSSQSINTNTGYRIALSALRMHYLANPANRADVSNIHPRMVEEFKKVRKALVPVTAEQLKDPKTLASKLEPSRFKGALLMGLINTNILGELDQRFHAQDAERAAQLTEKAREIDELTQETRNRLRREGKSLESIWQDTPGIVKLGLVIAGIYAVTQSKSARGAVLGLAGVYAFQKFLLKKESPVEGWAKFYQGIGAFVSEKNQHLLESIGLVNPDLDSGERAQIMVQFLSEYAREEIERSATGFGLLADVPIHEIVKVFKPRERDGKFTGDFSVEPGGNLERVLKAKLREKNLDYRKSLEFFRSAENLADVADALSHVCYMMEARESGNEHRKDIVERARGAFGTYDAIDAVTHPEAHHIYAEMVQTGRGRLVALDKSLAQVIMMLMEDEDIRRGARYVPKKGSLPSGAVGVAHPDDSGIPVGGDHPATPGDAAGASHPDVSGIPVGGDHPAPPGDAAGASNPDVSGIPVGGDHPAPPGDAAGASHP